MIATTFGVGQLVYSILWFFLFFVEIWLMISVFIDIFRSHDLKGWAKALWLLLVLVLPIIGILAYFIFAGTRCVPIRFRAISTRSNHSATMCSTSQAPVGPRPKSCPSSLS